MRILICSVSFCEYVIQQANALALLGHRIMIIVSCQLVDATVGQDLNNLLHSNVICYQYDTDKRCRPLFYINLYKAISMFTPEIIHIHESGELETLAVLLKYRNLPLVLTKHDVIPHPGADSKMILRRRLIMRYLSYCSNLLLVHSHSLQNDLLKASHTLGSKSMVIPHGSLTLFKHWENQNVENEPFTCLFFGRMEKYRGLDNLISIGEILKDILPNIKIIVAGTGTELPKYKEQMIALNIFEIYDYFIPNREVARLFQRSSLLLLPYHEASQSGVVHVAIPFGLPVVATAVGSISDVIVDNVHGRIIAVKDNKKFAETVKDLLIDPDKLRLMKNECLKLADKIEFESLAVDFAAAYEWASNSKASFGAKTYV